MGDLDLLFAGRKFINLLVSAIVTISFSYAQSATEDFVVCVVAPPNSSADTISFVTVFTTSGPVTNI